jgi:hypothetical protein
MYHAIAGCATSFALLEDVALVDEFELLLNAVPDAAGGVAVCSVHPATIKQSTIVRVQRGTIVLNPFGNFL